jgi:hypothetical protein
MTFQMFLFITQVAGLMLNPITKTRKKVPEAAFTFVSKY